MQRRKFVTLLGGAAIASPLYVRPRAAHAQQVRRVGVLMPLTRDDPEDQARATAFEDGLKQLGWIEGRNLHLEYRWYAGEAVRAGSLAKELIDLRSEVIMVGATPGTMVLRQETRTIPMVFVAVSDPVGNGLVDNLTRPGGNATGLTYFEFTVGSKLLEVLKQAAPNVTRVAVVYNPQASVYAPYLNSVQSAASSYGMTLVPSPVREPAEIDSALEALSREPGGGIICLPDSYLNVHRQLIVELAARYKLPAMYPARFFATAGGLISYGVDVTDLYRRSASYVDRILKGAIPSDLPVQQPTKYELVLNMKTAKTMGLTIPLTLQVTADEVIE
jgi:putative tryptophan/tyrosine transport system substrate-binding protein